MAEHTLKQEWEDLDNDRTSLLDRKRECSSLTIRTLLPDEEHNQDDAFLVQFDSMGARGVASLASKFVSGLVPLNSIPSFEISPELPPDTETNDLTEITEELRRLERKVISKLEATNRRAAYYLACQHLIGIGDVMIRYNDDYSFSVYRIDQYVCRRLPSGQVTKMILKEMVDPAAMPPHTTVDSEERREATQEDELEEFYTRITWVPEDGTWLVDTEFRDNFVETEKAFKVSPFTILRWSAVAGEDYGRGLCEDLIGYLRSAESLARAMAFGSAANADYRWGVDPTGLTEVSDLEDSDIGDYVSARPDDIFPIQLNNAPQMATTQAALTEIHKELGISFLMNSAIQPTGDRVTATQIRSLANELEETLGGAFSVLSRDFLTSHIRRTILLMEADQLLPAGITELLLEGDVLTLKIKTGLEALNREIEHAKLEQIMERVGQMPPEYQAEFNINTLLNRWLTAFGIEVDGLIRTREEAAQDQAQAAQAQLAQIASQQAVESAGAVAESQLAPPQG